MKARPKLLDLFCKAGGAAMGYRRAGFEVYGVDNESQPHYPFEFIQADAIDFVLAYGTEFQTIHASPPCQRFSVMTKMHGTEHLHPDLILEVRRALPHGVPYVIENVPGAPLNQPITLCGSSFNLSTFIDSKRRQLRRHRLFESSVPLERLKCQHQGRTIGVYGSTGGSSRRDGVAFGKVADWREAMGIDWMTGDELRQAIPPAYTEYIGAQIMLRLAGWEG